MYAFWTIGSWTGGITTNRAGSYGINMHLLNASLHRHDPVGRASTNDYTLESQVQQPMATPVLADCVGPWVTPFADDPAPKNLVYGSGGGGFRGASGMHTVAIPRHGSRPNPVPTDWPANKSLPGAVNVAFFDGHGEAVKLDQLWQLYWHRNYKPLTKRPGL
jgi:prepilin-type processing-associated H-X9-DG protein